MRKTELSNLPKVKTNLNPGSLPPGSHLNPMRWWVRAQVTSTHEVRSLNTRSRWDNKVTRQSPQITLSLDRWFKSHIIYPRGEHLQQPWTWTGKLYCFRLSPDEESTCLWLYTTKKQGKPHTGESDRKSSPMKSFFRISGWLKRPVCRAQLGSLDRPKRKEANPVCEPSVWSSDMQISECIFGDARF